MGFEKDGMIHRVIDSKAMRKVEDGEDLVVVVETNSVSNGAVAVSSYRQLIKLH